MKETKIFSDVEVKEFDEKTLTVEHFISTETRDRGGDIMKADGMLIRGRPVVLLAHGFSGMGQEPVAKPLKIEAGAFKGKKGILARTQFYPDATGRRLWEKTTKGFMPNWSIGYLVLEKEDFRDEEGPGRIIKKWELLEYSPVGVSMNPEATTISDGDKPGNQMTFKIFGSHLLNLGGQTITIVDRSGRPLSYEEVKRAIEQEVSAFYWSIRSAK